LFYVVELGSNGYCLTSLHRGVKGILVTGILSFGLVNISTKEKRRRQIYQNIHLKTVNLTMGDFAKFLPCGLSMFQLCLLVSPFAILLLFQTRTIIAN